MRFNRTRPIVSLAMLAGVWFLCHEEARAGDLLSPWQYTPIAASLTEGGSYTINTSGTTPTMQLPDGTILNGVVDPTNQVAVFTFGSIEITPSTTPGNFAGMNVSGSRSVAFLSRGNITLSDNVSVNAYATNTSAGPGGFGGPNYGVYGGPGNGGYGHLSGGGGAGYGGAGGMGGTGAGFQPDPFLPPGVFPGGLGGSTYGLNAPGLLGGSAGGAGFDFLAGAGGGAIEFGATGSINASGLNVNVSGGNGNQASGGGSGGEVAFLGSSVSLSSSTINLQGGDGGDGGFIGGPSGGPLGGGGGGGGGLLEFVSNSLDLSSNTFDLQGGTGGGGSYGEGSTNGLAGNSGSIVEFAMVPEPSSLAMGLIASALGIAVAIGRQTMKRITTH